MKVYGYIRNSINKESSMKSQEVLITEYCALHNLEFEIIKESGSSVSSEAVESLKQASMIIVTSIDRLGREFNEVNNVVAILKGSGADIASLSPQDDVYLNASNPDHGLIHV